MMAYFKAAENEAGLLERKLFFEKLFIDPQNRIQAISAEEEIQVGKSYSVLELIERSIIYSDNQATQLLLSHLDLDYMKQVFARLDIESDIFSVSYSAADTISIKEYTSFFRILYNASFLTYDYSELALSILSRTNFPDGLRAGTPSEVKVAHKFGEAGKAGEFRQLHDCGIIYYPERPYLLCVMTRGENIGDMASAIKDIANFVYTKVDAQLK